MAARPTIFSSTPVPADRDDRRILLGPAEIAGLIDAIATELWRGFDGRYARPGLTEIVRQAIADLIGSVTFDSLPEMATRLAAVRVTDGLGTSEGFRDQSWTGESGSADSGLSASDVRADGPGREPDQSL